MNCGDFGHENECCPDPFPLVRLGHDYKQKNHVFVLDHHLVNSMVAYVAHFGAHSQENFENTTLLAMSVVYTLKKCTAYSFLNVYT